MLDVAKSLPEDPEELRRFTTLLLAEVKSQAMLIEKLRHQLAGHRSHRFGTSSGTIEQLQLALEASEGAVAKMIAKLRLPDEEKNALFAGHDAGAENSAVIASLIETCKLNAVGPHAWLAASLSAITTGHMQSQVNDLLPWNYPGKV